MGSQSSSCFEKSLICHSGVSEVQTVAQEGEGQWPAFPSLPPARGTTSPRRVHALAPSENPVARASVRSYGAELLLCRVHL